MHTIRDLREKAGITQTLLAKELGISQAAVAQWENELSRPDIQKLPELARILGCTIDELFREKDMLQ